MNTALFLDALYKVLYSFQNLTRYKFTDMRDGYEDYWKLKITKLDRIVKVNEN